jgi:hypothetical protein
VPLFKEKSRTAFILFVSCIPKEDNETLATLEAEVRRITVPFQSGQKARPHLRNIQKGR